MPSVFPDRNLFFCFRLRRRCILRCVLLSTFRQLPADRRRRYPRDFGGAHVRRSMTKRSVAVRRRAREIVFFLGDSHTRPIRDRLYYIYICMIMCVSVYAYPTRVRVYRYISMLWTGVGRGKKKTACTPRQIGSVYFRVFRRRRDHGGLGEQPRFIHRKNWRSTKSKRLPARVEETRRAVTGGRPDGEVGDGGRNLRFSWSNGSRQLYHKVGMLYLFVYVQYHYRHVNLDVTVDRSFDLIWAFTERNRRKIRAGLRSSNGNILILLRPRHGFLN